MDWVWCLNCQRSFPADLYRSLPEGCLCAYEDCSGRAPYEMLPWMAVRALHPEYPEVPRPGRVYLAGAPALMPGVAVKAGSREPPVFDLCKAIPTAS